MASNANTICNEYIRAVEKKPPWYRTVYNFNIVFIVSGIVIICLGIWMLVVCHRLAGLTKYFDSTPSILIIYGLAIILIASTSFFFLTRPILLFLYCLVVFILCLWGILLGGYIFLSQSNLENNIYVDISSEMTKCTSTDPTVMEKIQKEMQCCGNIEPLDWYKTPLGQIPSSCCKVPGCVPKMENIFTDGCSNKIRGYIHDNVDIIGIVILTMTLIPMFGVIFIFCLCYETFTVCSPK